MNMFRALSAVIAMIVAVAVQAQPAQAAIKTQYIEYMHGNTPLKGYLAYDDAVTGKRPGVLLAHYRGGLQGETLEDAQMIAKMGYVVFAEDIFGKDIVPKTVPEMTALTTIYNSDRPLMRTRARSGFDVLAKHPMVDATKIAVVGYCFGGTVAVELAETGVAALGHHRGAAHSTTSRRRCHKIGAISSQRRRRSRAAG
jgi:dienelactone hydrolase